MSKIRMIAYKSIFLASMAAFMLLSCVESNAQQIKIGFIDLEKVFLDSVAYKQAFQELKQLQSQKSEELKQKEMQIVNSEHEFNIKKELISEDQAKTMLEQINREKTDFRQRVVEEQKGFADMRDKKLTPLNQELRKIIEQVAKQEGYAFVFKKDDVLYADEKYDLTNQVIETLNKK